MCFFYKQSKDAQALENRFAALFENRADFQMSDYINGFTFPQASVIANDNPVMIRNFQWGLIPFWAKDRSVQKYTLNARIETIGEKPSFRDSINRRCMIIADGFFEWQWLDPKGKAKQKYEISLPGNEIFSFGGLWSEWVDKTTGDKINSCTIVTTEANDFMSEIHNSKKRMPVILTNHNEQAWLNGNNLSDFKNMEVDLVAKKV